ncbi:MAG TPA: triose-phosphate isomerase [Thermomicrobiales bacterium]|nr:triose-phosphate isomerase [Thermomicrobiales bacterium]
MLFGTNFKMNQTPAGSAAFFTALAGDGAVPAGVQLFVIPPFTSLPAVTALAAAKPSAIWIGAQNMHWAADGAYTGEISATMLQALGVDLVLLGHAERRRLFHETDPDVNRKALAAVARDLRVLLCVGETAEERGYGVGGETVARQLKIDLHHFEPRHFPLLQIAYEPVWSIGAGGTPALPEDVEPMARLIRDVLGDRFGEAGRATPVLYGGSVDANNAGGFVRLPDIDGLFVGRAAWTVDGFRAVLDAALQARFDRGSG